MKGTDIWRTFSSDRWLDDLPPALRQSALSLYGTRVVFGLRRAILPQCIQIEGIVATRDRGDCRTFVEIRGPRIEDAHTTCSCPVQRHCKHAWATVLAGISSVYWPRDDFPQPQKNSTRILEVTLRPVEEHDEASEALAPPPDTRPCGTPTPMLSLFAEYPYSGYFGYYSSIPYGVPVRLARLDFIYAEEPEIQFPLGAGSLGGVGWRRDQVQERACASILEKTGLRRCGEVLDSYLKEELRDVFVAHPDHTSDQPWVDLLLTHLPGLTSHGWKTATSDSFDLNIVHPDHFYEEIRECGKPNFFAADLGIQVGGERFPMLPLLAHYLKGEGQWTLKLENLAARGDDPVLLPLDEEPGIKPGSKRGRRMVPVPASRLHRILSALAELYTAGTKALDGDHIILHKLRAAELLSEEPDNAVMAARIVENLRELSASLRSGITGSTEDVPEGLQASLRPYQLEGFRWLRFLARHGLGGILADDMGLGKTIQTLAHLLAEKISGAATRPSLIVCPTSVLHNWRDEARKFCPSLKVRTHHGPDRLQSLRFAGECDLLITSYPLLARDAAELAEVEFHAVVLDEAQFIKNHRTNASRAACELRSNLRLALTGTPMENHLGELWSLYEFLMPGLLGGWEEFGRQFRNPIEKQQDTGRRSILIRRITPVFLRRTKSAVLHDLPPKIESVMRIPFSQEQADLYESVRASMDERIRREIGRHGIKQSQIFILDALLKLRQVCCHPSLLKIKAATGVNTSVKLEALMDLVEPLAAEGRRMLVFSQFTSMLSIISDTLKEAGIAHLMLTGASKDRGALVREFQEGTAPVFLISLKAGGTGLNLTAADTVIHYDPWWNPAVESQATDRAHRMGQQNTVFVHKLICEGTIEERILQLQASKAELLDSLMAGGGAAGGLTAADIDFLLKPL